VSVVSAEIFRRAYVKCMHGLRPVLRMVGILGLLERADTRRARWLRSLFAIYDLDDLAYLNLPWWTFDAVDFVAVYLADRQTTRVFEWGSGASTIWLSRQGVEITSIEHDPDWAKRVAHLIKEFPATTLKAVPTASHGSIGSKRKGYEGQFFDDYVKSIRDCDGTFDLIVIDGRAREACLTEAIKKLAPDGYIIFDNTNRQRYELAIEGSGMKRKRLTGLTVCLPFPDATDLLSHSKTEHPGR